MQNPKLFYLPPTKEQLEKFWLLCLFVAGKTAHIQQGKLQLFLNRLAAYFGKDLAGYGPLECLAAISLDRRAQLIEDSLKEIRAGQYVRLTAAIVATTKILPVLYRNDHIQLVRRNFLADYVPGVGLKTASFFCMYGHGFRCAVLDTHIMQHMKEKGRVPAQFSLTPASYQQAEIIFLEMCDEYARSPWDMDFEIWVARASSSGI